MRCEFCGTPWGSRYTKPKEGTTTNERVGARPTPCCTGHMIKIIEPSHRHMSGLGRKNPHRTKIQRQHKLGLQAKFRKRQEKYAAKAKEKAEAASA